MKTMGNISGLTTYTGVVHGMMLDPVSEVEAKVMLQVEGEGNRLLTRRGSC